MKKVHRSVSCRDDRDLSKVVANLQYMTRRWKVSSQVYQSQLDLKLSAPKLQAVAVATSSSALALTSGPKLGGADPGPPPIMTDILPLVSLMRTLEKLLRPTTSVTASLAALSPAAYLAASMALSWL